MRSRRYIAAQLAFSAVLIGLLAWRTDVPEALDVAAGGNYIFLLLAFPLYLASNFVAALRTRVALEQMGEVEALRLFEANLVANMANLLLPMRFGDILKGRIIARRYSLPVAGVLAEIFVTETLLDGVAFVLLFLWTLALFGVPGVLLNVAWTLSALVLIGVFFGAAGARIELTEGWEERGPARRLPARIRGPLGRIVPDFLQGLTILRNIRRAALALTGTIAAWALLGGAYYAFSLVFRLDLSLAGAVVVMMAASFIISIPVVPTGLGTYEAAVTGVAVLLGASNGEALAFAVGSHVMLIAFAAVSGLGGMWLLRLAPREVLTPPAEPLTLEPYVDPLNPQRLT